MRLYFDLDSRQFIQAAGIRQAIDRFSIKRADSADFSLQFIEGGIVKELTSGTTFRFSLKKPADFQGDYLVTTAGFTKTGTGVSTVYTFAPDFNTEELNDFLLDGTLSEIVADEAARFALTGKALGYLVRQTDTFQYWKVIDAAKLNEAAGWELAPMKVSALCDAELEWVEPGSKRGSGATAAFYVFSDINRGTESMPTPVGPGFYNKEEADARFALLAPTDGNYRIKDGVELQIRETAPTPGWRSIFFVDGGLQAGPLET